MPGATQYILLGVKMLKIVRIISIILFVLINSATAQKLFHSFGVTANVAFPTDQLSSTHKTGYELGGELNLEVSSPSWLLHIAGTYNYFPGKTVLVEDPEDNTISNFTFHNYDFYKLILGIKVLNEKGFFIKPVLIGAFDTNYERIGAEFGFGYGFNLLEKVRGEVGAKLSVVNIFGNKENEITTKTMGLGVSLIF